MTKREQRRTIVVQPTKPVSAAGVFVLAFMFLFGVGFAAVVANVLYENDAPLGLAFLFLFFMVGWLGTVGFMFVYHYRNLREGKGLPVMEIDVIEDGADEAGTKREGSPRNR